MYAIGAHMYLLSRLFYHIPAYMARLCGSLQGVEILPSRLMHDAVLVGALLLAGDAASAAMR